MVRVLGLGPSVRTGAALAAGASRAAMTMSRAVVFTDPQTLRAR